MRDGVACLELFLVDRVPVKEKVCDRAVILREVANERRQLRVSQAIVAKSIWKMVLQVRIDQLTSEL